MIDVSQYLSIVFLFIAEKNAIVTNMKIGHLNNAAKIGWFMQIDKFGTTEGLTNEKLNSNVRSQSEIHRHLIRLDLMLNSKLKNNCNVNKYVLYFNFLYTICISIQKIHTSPRFSKSKNIFFHPFQC